MKSNWTTAKLGELVSFSSGGTPSKNVKEYWNGTIPWVSAKSMKSERISSADLMISEAGLSAGSKMAPVDSLLLLTRGSGLFNGIPVCIVEKPVAFNQDVKCIESCSDVSSRFIFYWLKANEDYLRAKLEVTGIGAGKFDTKFLQELQVELPPENERQRIVAIADAISEKIITNARINDNLYDLLQSVYQLQFGVTSGNAAEGILSDICSYTKDRIAVSELSLGNYYSTENMLPGKAGFTEATSLPTTPQTTRCNAGDVLVSNIRPYFKKIVLCHSEGGCSTDVLCFAPKAPAYSAYLFCTLYADRFFDFMVAGSKGTKMPRGDKQQIMTYPVYIPTESELTAFADFATPILSQIHGNNEENARLEHLRDTLLPKLMSGEIDVSAIDI